MAKIDFPILDSNDSLIETQMGNFPSIKDASLSSSIDIILSPTVATPSVESDTYR